MAIKLCSLCKLQPRSPFSVWIFSLKCQLLYFSCFGFSKLEASTTKIQNPFIKPWNPLNHMDVSFPHIFRTTVFIRKNRTNFCWDSWTPNTEAVTATCFPGGSRGWRRMNFDEFWRWIKGKVLVFPFGIF